MESNWHGLHIHHGMKEGKAFIGTSGWNYGHWKGTFYPSDIKNEQEFDWYAQKLHTVELNNPFYHLPPPETFANWRTQSPAAFRFAVKASRYITHMKKLIVDTSSIDLFFSHADQLEEKLGPVLFQLPPRFKVNVERLETFLKALPKGHRYTFEFRDVSWYTNEVYDLLNKFNCAFCIYELERHLSPLQVSADFVYVRLHGPGNKYQGTYEDVVLEQWCNRIKDWQRQHKDVYVYFDNDQEGYAAFNAITLQAMLQ